MLEACRRNRVQFMDGVMFMHSGRMARLRQLLDDNQSVGAIRRIASQFSFLGQADFLTQNIRVNSDLEPLGCVGDLGWYNIRFSLWALNHQLPERVSGRILAAHCWGETRQPVPTEFSGELFFTGGITASFYCSFLAANQQWANISGTRGFVQVPDFVVPFFGCEVGFEVGHTVFHVQGCDFNMENHSRRHTVAEYSNSAPSSQETNMIRTFARIVASGQMEPAWGDIALGTQQVVDACLRSARAGGERVSVN
jgi:predicted dehydrogenase